MRDDVITFAVGAHCRAFKRAENVQRYGDSLPGVDSPAWRSKHRLADASYWLYDRSRHKTAFEAAAQPGTAPDFSGFENHKAGDVEGTWAG